MDESYKNVGANGPSSFKRLALDEGYPNPDGARTDVSNAPTKENLSRGTKPASCDETDAKHTKDTSYSNSNSK